MAAIQSGCVLDWGRARPIRLRGSREYVCCKMSMQQVAVATHPQCRDFRADKAVTGGPRPQLRARGLFGGSQESAITVPGRERLPVVGTRHGAGGGEAGLGTAESIAAEQEKQRGEQTCDDGFEVSALPWRSVIPQASIFHGHPSMEACGTLRRLFPPRPVIGQSYTRRSALMRSAAFSAIITTGEAVLPETMRGMIEASTTRRP